jgi:hypothetical protein
VLPTTGAGDRRRVAQRLVVVVAAASAVLCLSAAVIGFLAYDRATRPDRSAPEVVADSYLRGLLVNRSDANADRYTCRDPGDGLDPIEALRDELIQREREFDVTVTVTWGALAVVGDRVNVELAIRTPVPAGGTARSTQRWSLTTVEEGGEWRVCGASRMA